MTRDTKIGLLVGLLFIIIVGILLAQYATNINEPVSANVAGAGGDVRDGVATPSDPTIADAPPVTVAGATPGDEPRHVVRTRGDLRAVPPVTFVPVPPRGTPGPTVNPDGNGGPTTPLTPDGQSQQLTQAGGEGSGQAAQRIAPPPGGPGDLLRQHPDDLAAVDRGNVPPASPRPPATHDKTEYAAVEGDSVSRMAGRLMGGNTKANRDALIAANPSLQADNNPVIVGRKYAIPKPIHTAAAPTPAPDAPSARGGSASTAEAARYYTVRGNDNLWKIAEAELGTGTAWTVIRDMNKDVLKGGETVHPEMRLRLPSRSTVAGAND